MASGAEAGFAIDRRTALIGAACCCMAGPAKAAAEGMPRENDRLVFADGDFEGKPVTMDMLTIGGAPVVAVPADPASGAAREGSRFNKIVLVRLAPEDIADEVHAHAADGVVALSAICTHQACTVNGWNPEAKALLCFCHSSQFYPGQGGKVFKGPARKRLPILPVKAGEDGAVVVAAALLGKPGPGA